MKSKPSATARCALFALVCGLSLGNDAAANAGILTNRDVFARPVVARTYGQTQWTLQNSSKTGLRETAESVGRSLAALQPSYVSGLIYLRDTTSVTQAMIDDYATIRSFVLARNPDARFDVEIDLDPNPGENDQPFASAAALLAFMDKVNAQLHPDGWWFDYYSAAEKAHPDWISAAISYAHARGQTVGGDVFGNDVPPNSDAVTFVDNAVTGSLFGFDFNRKEIAKLKASSPSTIILGTLQSNPQNGSSTESCVYTQQWTTERRFAYLSYWATQQSEVGFTFMYPVFYPLCPGAYSYDPLKDRGLDGMTLFERLWRLINKAPA